MNPPRIRSPVRRWLVVGYGNPWRGDDALGPRLAARLSELRLPHVTTRAVHQLVPELAEWLAQCDAAVFADAHPGMAEVELRPLEPHPGAGDWSHVRDPSALLALAQRLYGAPPPAWLLCLPAERFDPCAPLTPRASAALEAGLSRLLRLFERGPGM